MRFRRAFCAPKMEKWRFCGDFGEGIFIFGLQGVARQKMMRRDRGLKNAPPQRTPRTQREEESLATDEALICIDEFNSDSDVGGGSLFSKGAICGWPTVRLRT